MNIKSKILLIIISSFLMGAAAYIGLNLIDFIIDFMLSMINAS